MNDRKVRVDLGEQIMLRCSVCGSLETTNAPYCYHSEHQISGTLRDPVTVVITNRYDETTNQGRTEND